MLSRFYLFLFSCGVSVVAYGGGSGTVFSIAPGLQEVISDFSDGVTGVAKFNFIDLNALKTRSDLSAISTDRDLTDTIIIEGANTVSRHYLGSGSTFLVDWNNETIKFEDNSSAGFEEVVDEALEIETASN